MSRISLLLQPPPPCGREGPPGVGECPLSGLWEGVRSPDRPLERNPGDGWRLRLLVQHHTGTGGRGGRGQDVSCSEGLIKKFINVFTDIKKI